MQTTSRSTLDQQRARFAWGKAKEGIEQHPKAYRPLAKGAPALVMGSGLMPTLAFYESKAAREPHALLAQQLREWLGERFKDHPEYQPVPGSFAELMDRLHVGSSAFYMEATAETLAILKWIRQFADAVPSRPTEADGGRER